jgi:hypothetical protein
MVGGPIGIAGLSQIGGLLELSHPDLDISGLWPPVIPKFEQWFREAVDP